MVKISNAGLRLTILLGFFELSAGLGFTDLLGFFELSDGLALTILLRFLTIEKLSNSMECVLMYSIGFLVIIFWC